MVKTRIGEVLILGSLGEDLQTSFNHMAEATKVWAKNIYIYVYILPAAPKNQQSYEIFHTGLGAYPCMMDTFSTNHSDGVQGQKSLIQVSPERNT